MHERWDSFPDHTRRGALGEMLIARIGQQTSLDGRRIGSLGAKLIAFLFATVELV
jgi:hypothetical protein